MRSTERSPATQNALFPAMTARMAWLCFGGALAGGLIAAVSGGDSTELPKFYLIFQDAPALLLLGLFLLFAGRWATARGEAAAATIARMQGWGPAWIIALLAAGVSYAGAYLVYRHFALSVDEFMADFDARIIAAGRLLAPVAPEWRDYVPALQPIFLLEVPENAYWVSSYLPINAAIRAAFLLLGDPALSGAALAGVSLLALFGVARKLWPDRPDAAVVAVLLLACSPQFLVTAMTPYAMTAHLALNLVWLWLFLRDTRTSHVLAAAVGFAACGLHQVIFHPLFAAPFLLSVLLARRWQLAAFYAASYAAIGLFWILYWSWLLHDLAEPAARTASLGLAYQIGRIAEMVQVNIFASVSYMGLNLFRFVAWEVPLTIPLALIGVILCRRRGTLTRDLALGIVLTLAVVAILMPYQGHGWGYRYLHGLLGSLSLLAAQGWIALSERGETKERAPLLLASLAVSLLLLFPWFAWQARAQVTPYAAASAAIARSDAQIVVIDPTGIWYGIDLVRNDPFLRAAPKVMALGYLREAEIEKLCRSYDVALFDRRDAAHFGLRDERTELSSPRAFARYGELRSFMASLNCGRPVFGPR
jgi:hypothetical protein